jgi:PAS domain S-box-containing protein
VRTDPPTGATARPPLGTGPQPLSALLFDPGPTTELSAVLRGLAGRLRVALEVDLAAIVVNDELDPAEVTRGVDVADERDARLLAPLLDGDGDAFGLAGQAVWTASTVIWPNMLTEPAIIDRLAELSRVGIAVGAATGRLSGASGVAVPLATPHHPRLGAVVLVSFDPLRPAGAPLAARVEDVARQLSLTVRNHQYRDRNRRTRLILEAVLESNQSGIVVTDLRERLLTVNRAACDLLAVDMAGMVGESMREVVADRLRWRFVEPAEYVRRTLAIYDDPETSVHDELHTVDGKVLERFSAPVRDAEGELLGRVEILSDVSVNREALAEAHRLAEETAQLRMMEEMRAREEMALARAAHLMASALTRADIHEHLLDQAEELSACDACAVLLVDRHGEVTTAAAHGLPPDSRGRVEERGGERVVGRVLGSRRPFICNDVEAEGPSLAAGLPPGTRSSIHVPLLLGERPYGVLMVGSRRVRAFGGRELRMLADLANHAGLALQNAMQFEQERHAAETLQHALLPDELPTVPGLQMAGLYRAAAGAQVGGDFYGAWRMPGGEVAVLVGDVSGKGVEAAGLTAAVRYAAEGVSMYERDPGRMVTRLNELVLPKLPAATFVTLVLVVVDLPASTLDWCSAGHVPPLVMSAAGALTTLEPAEPPCGAFPGQRYGSGTVTFEPGDTLVLHTDGITEARRGVMEFGEERLHELVRQHAGESPRTLARTIYQQVSVWSEGRVVDDVAIAVVTRTAG